MKAQVMRTGLLDMQVCVPKEWTDEQVLNFAEKENPCGTVNENCHIILDAQI